MNSWETQYGWKIMLGNESDVLWFNKLNTFCANLQFLFLTHWWEINKPLPIYPRGKLSWLVRFGCTPAQTPTTPNDYAVAYAPVVGRTAANTISPKIVPCHLRVHVLGVRRWYAARKEFTHHKSSTLNLGPSWNTGGLEFWILFIRPSVDKVDTRLNSPGDKFFLENYIFF